MDIFETTPIQKWQEVILHASPTLVGLELESILARLASYELMLEHENIEIEECLKKISTECAQEFVERQNSLAIESMAKILSNHE